MITPILSSVPTNTNLTKVIPGTAIDSPTNNESNTHPTQLSRRRFFQQLCIGTFGAAANLIPAKRLAANTAIPDEKEKITKCRIELIESLSKAADAFHELSLQGRSTLDSVRPLRLQDLLEQGLRHRIDPTLYGHAQKINALEELYLAIDKKITSLEFGPSELAPERMHNLFQGRNARAIVDTCKEIYKLFTGIERWKDRPKAQELLGKFWEFLSLLGIEKNPTKGAPLLIDQAKVDKHLSAKAQFITELNSYCEDFEKFSVR